MATTENTGLLTYIDEAGNKYLLYPVTRAEAVDGLEELLAQKAPASHVTDKNNPHGVTAAQVGARPNTWTPTASEVGAAPASHVTDKNNPHGVTAEQVGAIPRNGQFYSDGDFDSFTTSGRFVIGGGNIKHAPDGNTSGYYNLDVISFSGITTHIATSIWTRDVYFRRLDPSVGVWEPWGKVLTNTFAGKVLWINGSVNSSFPAQTIGVPNMSQYRSVIVSLFDVFGGEHIQHTVNKDTPYINGPYVQTLSYDGGTISKLKRKMIVDFTNSTITFESGYHNNSVNDSKIVPAYVIGIV